MWILTIFHQPIKRQLYCTGWFRIQNGGGTSEETLYMLQLCWMFVIMECGIWCSKIPFFGLFYRFHCLNYVVHFFNNYFCNNEIHVNKRIQSINACILLIILNVFELNTLKTHPSGMATLKKWGSSTVNVFIYWELHTVISICKVVCQKHVGCKNIN